MSKALSGFSTPVGEVPTWVAIAAGVTLLVILAILVARIILSFLRIVARKNMTASEYAENHAAGNTLGFNYSGLASLALCKSIACTEKIPAGAQVGLGQAAWAGHQG